MQHVFGGRRAAVLRCCCSCSCVCSAPPSSFHYATLSLWPLWLDFTPRLRTLGRTTPVGLRGWVWPPSRPPRQAAVLVVFACLPTFASRTLALSNGRRLERCRTSCRVDHFVGPVAQCATRLQLHQATASHPRCSSRGLHFGIGRPCVEAFWQPDCLLHPRHWLWPPPRPVPHGHRYHSPKLCHELRAACLQ